MSDECMHSPAYHMAIPGGVLCRGCSHVIQFCGQDIVPVKLYKYDIEFDAVVGPENVKTLLSCMAAKHPGTAECECHRCFANTENPNDPHINKHVPKGDDTYTVVHGLKVFSLSGKHYVAQCNCWMKRVVELLRAFHLNDRLIDKYLDALIAKEKSEIVHA